MSDAYIPPQIQYGKGVKAMDMQAKAGYGKDNANQIVCENPGCGALADLLFMVQEMEDNKLVNKNYCEKCFKEYWLARGYIV